MNITTHTSSTVIHQWQIITGIDTIFNVLIHRNSVSQCIAIIGYCDLNNMILKVQIRLLSWHWNRIGLKKKVGLFCKKVLHYLSIAISLYHDTFGAMH